MKRETSEILRAAKIVGVDPDSLEYADAQKILQEYIIDSADITIRTARKTRKPQKPLN